MADNEDGEFVKQRVQDLTGKPTFAAGYAFAWQEAIRKFATFFPNKHLAVALSVGITAPSDQPSWHRDSTPSKWIYYYLRSQEYKQNYGNPVHLMTFNLTGKDWMQPGEGNSAQEVISFVEEAPKYNFTTGFQEVGIAYATVIKEERARPFILGLQKGIDLGASWIEIWPEDLLADRLHLHQTRGWVDQTHPCLNAACSDDGTFEQIISTIKQTHTGLGGVLCQPQDLNCDGTTNILDLLHWRKNMVTGETGTQTAGILGYPPAGRQVCKFCGGGWGVDKWNKLFYNW